jgi:hypothetical protein
MKGFKDKQAPLSTKRLTSGNAGSPKRGNPHGDGVPIVVGVRENLVQGEGEQVIQGIDQGAARDAPVFNHKRTGRPLETGKPYAATHSKVWRPLRAKSVVQNIFYCLLHVVVAPLKKHSLSESALRSIVCPKVLKA